MDDIKEQRKKDLAGEAVFPCCLKMLERAIIAEEEMAADLNDLDDGAGPRQNSMQFSQNTWRFSPSPCPRNPGAKR